MSELILGLLGNQNPLTAGKLARYLYGEPTQPGEEPSVNPYFGYGNYGYGGPPSHLSRTQGVQFPNSPHSQYGTGAGPYNDVNFNAPSSGYHRLQAAQSRDGHRAKYVPRIYGHKKKHRK